MQQYTSSMIVAAQCARAQTYHIASHTQPFPIHPTPYGFHILPIRHNAMLQRPIQLQEPAQLFCLVANEHISF